MQPSAAQLQKTRHLGTKRMAAPGRTEGGRKKKEINGQEGGSGRKEIIVLMLVVVGGTVGERSSAAAAANAKEGRGREGAVMLEAMMMTVTLRAMIVEFLRRS